MSALTVVVLAHVSMLVELMSVVRLCWTLRILSRRLRRGGGVLGWEASNYSWSDGFQNTFFILITGGRRDKLIAKSNSLKSECSLPTFNF